MFTTKKTKPTKQPQQPVQEVAIQDGQVIGVLLRRRTTFQKALTQTTKAALKIVTPKRSPAPHRPGREHLRRRHPPTGENQSFYRASYLALHPQRQWDLYLAGLAPQGVPAPRGPPPPQKGITPRQYKTVNVMYLTKPSPTGVQAGTISYLPDAFELAEARKRKKKQGNEDKLPAFPTPGEGGRVVQRPVVQGQGQLQQRPVKRPAGGQQLRVSTAQGQGGVRLVQVISVQQPQQQYVQVAVPVAQVQVQQARPQTQQFVAVPVSQVQGGVRPVQQQQRQQRPQTQFVTVPVQQVQQVQRPQQQQQQQFVVLQTVTQPQTQQQVVIIPAVSTQPARQPVRTGGRRVAGQSVVTVRA
ncbi:hypothetical protein B0T21DRAFT_409698 [Apiosordaria backusii]|uniref:Uncharacterized protein n=1 Tax=Apiosordaria backusii TaxID=314023 RepID=A0AA40BS35_9PEZI|nr:hypothetical protein B0T21DRAFT_409698 [Apiosordaria backusii]